MTETLQPTVQGSVSHSVWRYQPFVPVAAAFAAGVAVDHHWPLRVAAWLATAATTLVVWFVAALLARGNRRGVERGDEVRDRWAWLSSLSILLVVGVVGATWHHVCWDVYRADDIGQWCDRQSRPARVRGFLSEEPLVVRAEKVDPLRAMPQVTRTLTQLAVQEIEGSSGWRRATGNAHVVVEGVLENVHAGDAVEILGDVIAPAAADNPAEFDYSVFLRGRRTRTLIRCERPDAVQVRSEVPTRCFHITIARIAGACERRLVTRLPEEQAKIAVALLLGRYELLEEDVSERYIRTGTMHILAISGQHLAILAGFLWMVFRFAQVPRKAGALALAAIVVSYALLTGARPPVVRAAVLVCLLVGSIVLDARSRRANSLAFALLFVLALNPSDLFDRGLQLSFLAVAALLWMVEPVWTKLRREPDPIDQLIADSRPRVLQLAVWTGRLAGRLVLFTFIMSAVVWLANVPLLAARFNVFTPIVVPLSVAMWPPTTIALISGLGLLLVDPWSPLVGGLLADLCSVSIAGMDWLVEIGQQIPGGHWYVPGPPLWWVAGFYLGLAGMLLFRPGRRLRMVCATAGVAWLAFGLALPALKPTKHRLECHVLAVGNGSAAVLHLPTGRTVLVDAGQITGPRVGKRLIAPALWHAGVRRIDAVFISHADVDHFNGLPSLAERFTIGTVYVPPHVARAGSGPVRLVLDELAKRDVEIRICFVNDEFDLGEGVMARVLHPPAEFGGTDNEQSLVLAVEYRGKRILLTGDVEGAGLRRLLATESFPVDVLIAPHHGSRRANPPELARWCQPQFIVVSQGKPRSGATLDAYRDVGLPVLTTNDHGAITLRIDRNGLHVRTTR